MTKETDFITNREAKSSAFTAYFSEVENAVKLFEALEPGEKVSPEDIDFTTLKGVLFIARKNDLAFTVKRKVLVISEHQSTLNLNMPLRAAIYYGRTIEKLIEPRAIYRTKKITIPTPEFYVFYNGNDYCPPEKILKLSDSYLVKKDKPMLELSVKVININLPENHPILEACRPLYEYSWLIQRIKEYLTSGNNRDDAIIQAIYDCYEADIMVEFLKQHGSEAINMLYTQFNMEDALEVRGEEKFAEGKQQMISELAAKKLAKGKSLETIAEELETDIETIQQILEN